MSANNEVIIRRLTNGLYDIREVDVDAAAEYGIEKGTSTKIATDIDGLEKAVDIANKYLDEADESGYPIEYGLNIMR